MIANFGGNGIVQSFKMPYYCEACNKEYVISAETRQFIGKPAISAPEFSCPDCNSKLDFDDIEAKYFHFIERQKRI